MKAYRIGSGGHPVFDGTGAALFGGRWNAVNQRVIYAGSSFAIAMLERLCYTALGRVPIGDRFIEIDIPDSMIEVLDERSHPGWDEAGSEVAVALGSAWWRAGRCAVLSVPSALTRIDRNLVINQDHPNVPRIVVGAEQPVRWDPRLFRR
jgi:RES domain-containing protein